MTKAYEIKRPMKGLSDMVESMIIGLETIGEGLLQAAPALLLVAAAAASGWYGKAYVVQDQIQKDTPTTENVRPADNRSYAIPMYEHADHQRVLEAAKELGLDVQVVLVQKK